MKYVDASAILRVIFGEAGQQVPLDGGGLVTSQLVEVETFRAIDRERLLGRLDDATTGAKRKELSDFLTMLDLIPIDRHVIERARSSFAVNVRALDAIHVATAEILSMEASPEEVVFWTHDQRQATAALSRGLTVLGVERVAE